MFPMKPPEEPLRFVTAKTSKHARIILCHNDSSFDGYVLLDGTKHRPSEWRREGLKVDRSDMTGFVTVFAMSRLTRPMLTLLVL